MRAKSRLIETAGNALLPIYLRREGIIAYQCPEEDSHDFVISIKGRFIRIKVRSVHGAAAYPAIGSITTEQFRTCNYIIIYLLDDDRNRFFTIPISKVPRNRSIRFLKGKDGTIKGKWLEFEGFEFLKKELKNE
jgi:hypothetical protein